MATQLCPECNQPPLAHAPTCSIGKSLKTMPAAPIAKQVPAPIAEMSEAPYSWNVFAMSPDGYREQFTVRAITHEGFTARVTKMKEVLKDLGYSPAKAREATGETVPAQEAAPICPYHKVPMEKRQGKNGFFWSCHNKIEGTDQWCQYKPPTK